MEYTDPLCSNASSSKHIKIKTPKHSSVLQVLQHGAKQHDFVFRYLFTYSPVERKIEYVIEKGNGKKVTVDCIWKLFLIYPNGKEKIIKNEQLSQL